MWYLWNASEDDKAFDLRQFFFGEHPPAFAGEVALRTCVMFLVVLFGMKVLGKRGVKQLSVFELVIILGLGSAAGDPMFYREVGIITTTIVFACILALYRLVVYLLGRSKRFEVLIKGKPVCLIREGKLVVDVFRSEPLVHDEVFAELRQQSVSQLGQVRTAILETSGEISLFYYPDEEVRPGLPLLPDALGKPLQTIDAAGNYACTYCGETEEIKDGGNHTCPVCRHGLWVAATCEKREG